jgi:VWFA-related protein
MHALRQTIIILLAVSAGLSVETIKAPAQHAGAQQLTGRSGKVVKTESNLVLVDVLVTDKKGHYIRDLEEKDFRVYQDDKEQTISSFSRPSDLQDADPENQHYVVLFFDDSTISTDQQPVVRSDAGRFVSQITGPKRFTAVVDFGGMLRIEQNFTDKPDLLSRAVQNVRFSAVESNRELPPSEVASLSTSSLGPGSIEQMGNDFAARSMLLSIRNLCKTLKPIPGRKTLILLSGGFPLTPERQAELTATIDAANKSNVAIYPIDVRGLTNLSPNPFPGTNSPARTPGFQPGAQLENSPFPHEQGLLASLMAFPLPGQKPTGGGGGHGAPGGGGPGGGPGGGMGGGGIGGGPRGGGGISNPGGPTGPAGGGSPGGMTPGGFGPPGNTPLGEPGFPNNRPSPIIPPMLETTATNQQVLSALAAGTGGLTIFNTNDYFGGMNKIVGDLDQYYAIGYVPPDQRHDGSYHSIKVKVDRHGAEVRARNGYFDVKSPDLLAGTPEGATLAADAASREAGSIPISMQAPYFYTSPHVARVELALEVPGKSVRFRKIKGKYHYEVNVLGIAHREDGSVAARFSDAVKNELEKKSEKSIEKKAFDYRNTFEIAPGNYQLTVVLSTGGQEFGKLALPLSVAPYSGKTLGLSGLILSDEFLPASQLLASLDEKLLEGQLPLVAHGVQVIPSANNRFGRKREVGFYAEVYEPALELAVPPRVGVMFDIYNRKTDQRLVSSNTFLVTGFEDRGNPVIPIALRLPVAKLPPADYRLELQARDSLGHVSRTQSANFSLH